MKKLIMNKIQILNGLKRGYSIFEFYLGYRYGYTETNCFGIVRKDTFKRLLEDHQIALAESKTYYDRYVIAPEIDNNLEEIIPCASTQEN